ncbi:MAG: hypothetical protein AAF512_04645, partial [Pseudomonadota bacterium]
AYVQGYAGWQNIVTLCARRPDARDGSVAHTKHMGVPHPSPLPSLPTQGNSSFHSTGLNPGYMGDVLPLSMSSMSRQIDRIVVQEISTFQYYPSPEIMFESMGFGSEPEAFQQRGERRTNWLNGLFRESIQMVADGLEFALDEVKSEMVIAIAENDLETASGIVKTGTVAGQRWKWSGMKASEERIIHETVWRMHDDVAPEWPTGKHSINIEGEPNMHLKIDAAWISDGLLGTAIHAVNAIEAVIAAPPGIQTFLELPSIAGRGTMR